MEINVHVYIGKDKAESGSDKCIHSIYVVQLKLKMEVNVHVYIGKDKAESGSDKCCAKCLLVVQYINDCIVFLLLRAVTEVNTHIR